MAQTENERKIYNGMNDCLTEEWKEKGNKYYKPEVLMLLTCHNYWK